MPEGPELHLASRFINSIAKGRLFMGKVEKSPVSKNPDIPWDSPKYKLEAVSRGKEIKVLLEELTSDTGAADATPKTLSILIRFGMSGCFKFTPVAELPKHAHMRFYAEPKPNEQPMVLSFVDFRRFGRWEINSDWSSDRGPCPITEYEKFRSHVSEHLTDSAFGKPVCEVLLNQKYFNGIGNYLRAEILYRAGIPPFEEARKALLPWKDAPVHPQLDVKTEFDSSKDPLYLCHKLSLDVLGLDGGKGYDVEHDPEEEAAFLNWLQCYQNPSMSNLVDSHGRTIWFLGAPGPLAPKGGKSRRATPSKKTPKKEDAANDTGNPTTKIVKKLKLDVTDVEETVTAKNGRKIKKSHVTKTETKLEVLPVTREPLTSSRAARAARAARRAALNTSV